MYSYNNMPKYNENMYYPTNDFSNQNGDRFIGGGLFAPLLLGGIAGYAIGNNRPNYYPTYYNYPYPAPVYYNNYYYPYY